MCFAQKVAHVKRLHLFPAGNCRGGKPYLVQGLEPLEPNREVGPRGMTVAFCAGPCLASIRKDT